MSYTSIDTLQKALGESVFSHTKDSKKAAGRALGTLVEIISFYLLKEWGLIDYISIERGLQEYGNPSITHNVEFTLHPLISKKYIPANTSLPITATKILHGICLDSTYTIKKNTLIDKDATIKNACVIAESPSHIMLASINDFPIEEAKIQVYIQHQKPFAMFECKRVGVEEGARKGPQTIEKAKQGAYVAQNTSSLQKIRNNNGERYGIIYDSNGNMIVKPYNELMDDIVNGDNDNLLRDFTLSVGIVSNHGNWFTSENQNKELKVLAQSYDWLLFLTDNGLSTFITDLLLQPKEAGKPVQKAFFESYKEGKKSNIFTKVRMNVDAHIALCDYFKKNIKSIEKWFNIITPDGNVSLLDLKRELFILKDKDWRKIL